MEKSRERSREKISTKEKSWEKRQNEGKTSGEIENWKCDLVALNGLHTQDIKIEKEFEVKKEQCL